MSKTEFIVNIRIKFTFASTESKENLREYVDNAVDSLITPMNETWNVMEEEIVDACEDIERIEIDPTLVSIEE